MTAPVRRAAPAALRFTLACAALGAACARQPQRAAPAPSARGANSTSRDTLPAWLSVESHNRANVVLYAVRGNARQRLGMVVAGATQRFQLPRHIVSDPAGFVLLADPIGGDPSGRTEVLRVLPGQQVVWTLEASLARSSVAIYN